MLISCKIKLNEVKYPNRHATLLSTLPPIVNFSCLPVPSIPTLLTFPPSFPYPPFPISSIRLLTYPAHLSYVHPLKRIPSSPFQLQTHPFLLSFHSVCLFIKCLILIFITFNFYVLINFGI